jgi:pimeloyl-ACP methyl ester carboxylesterase
VIVPLALVLAIGAAISWHFSSEVLVPDHSGRPADVTVEEVGARTVVLSRDEDTERPGVYGIEWRAGHARIGPVARLGAETVTRRLSALSGYLAAGQDVAIANVHAGDPKRALGVPFRNVEVPGELGPMPAWLVPPVRDPPRPGRSIGATDEVVPDTWAISVHGINGDPQIGLTIVPALRRAGLSTLLVTYRNDLGAPESPDGLHHLGLTEWRDVEAAARYAIRHGARRLVLIGYSMGGSLVAQFMERSHLAGRVAALVLDAPALDWEEVLSFHAEEMGLPGFASIPLRWAIGRRIDVDWDSLDALDDPAPLRVPTLLFHGTEDDIVPISISEELAAELPGLVTYHRVDRAGHCEAWNVGPALYERRLRGFLAREVLRR